MGMVHTTFALLTILLSTTFSFPVAAQAHADAQIAAVGRLLDLMQRGADDQARGLLEIARAMAVKNPRNDTLRADAIELEKTYLRAKEQFKDALPLSREVLKLRRRAQPVESVLLGFALYDHAIITLANQMPAEADAAFREGLDAFRDAFGSKDVRLAQRLKAAAAFVGDARGFNRPRSAIDLLTEAVAVRQRAPDSSGEALADTLQELAMLEMRYTSPQAADRHLEEAALLVDQAARAEQAVQRREVLDGGHADILILRAGIAAKGGFLADADTLVRRAQALLPKTNSDDVIGQKITIAEIRSQILERTGDLDGAIRQADEQLALALSVTKTDPLLVADIAENIGTLQLAAGNLDEAENAFHIALRGKGGEANAGTAILLRQAEIKARRGQAQEAEALYRRGLAQRKTETSEVQVLYATNRVPLAGPVPMFGGERSAELSFGEALVLVPGGPGSKDAAIGSSAADVTDLGPATAAERLIVLPPRLMPLPAFESTVRQRAARASVWRGTALVFVHGFGTRFTSALARAGQITRDLGYDAPAFVFSWPSQGVVSRDAYFVDQDRSLRSADSLVSFLSTVAETTGAAKIHIVAHSMGNRVMLPSLAQLRARPGIAERIGEVVFASPDVDQREFEAAVAGLRGLNLTLYASANDKAMWASWFANLFSTRAGFVGRGFLASGLPVITAGLDSIDVSAAGTDILSFNHDVYATNPIIIDDLRRLLQQGTRPPDMRSHNILKRGTGANGAPYWIYHRT